MYEITFKYRDEASNGEWKTQKCYMSSVEECKKVVPLPEISFDKSPVILKVPRLFMVPVRFEIFADKVPELFI